MARTVHLELLRIEAERRGDAVALQRLARDEPGALELHHRLAHRRGRHVELTRDGVDREALARCRIAAEQQLQDAIVDMIAQAAPLDRRVQTPQGAVLTVQGAGAALSPALGGWIAEWVGYSPTFLVLGGMGLLASALWIAMRSAIRHL